MSDDNTLAPLTFKLPAWMLKKINEMVDNDEYTTKAELIRDAIQRLIDWELSIPSVNED
ncbi:MAG: ribbon-helix-helix domain-containing protein [Candidatus Heimdallarchaeota archaeon]|nr:ribbon-helix-helix domain-containing protein [Candidatus Heimdallarchaeota archaeon]MDH5646667.1 ribbon-helix-helix domain-containing protein [Candidatus Heimdallarchaeota archaeon]